MSRLQELVDELCPNGVEFKKVEDVLVSLKTGLNPRQNFKLNVDGAQQPYITGKDIFDNHIVVSDRTDLITQEAVELINKRACLEDNDLLFLSTGTGTVGRMALIDEYDGTWSISESIYALKSKEDIIVPKYLMYYLYTEQAILQYKPFITKASVPHLRVSDLMKVKLPVPPLEVQREIVRVLDSFTLLLDKLLDELTDELTARKKQYEYYRNELISKTEGTDGKLIDMLAQPITDGPHTTPILYAEGVPFVSATAVYDGRVHINDMKGFISKEFDAECAKKYKPQRDDVFMVKSGSTTGKVAYVDFDDDFNIWSPLAAMRVNDDNLPRYLFHLLQTTDIQLQVQERMSHGSQPNLSMRVLEQFDVKIPSLEKQKQIVDLLDKLDYICGDMFAGLPAEIEARKKQYEYYRDKLLSFKELGA